MNPTFAVSCCLLFIPLSGCSEHRAPSVQPKIALSAPPNVAAPAERALTASAECSQRARQTTRKAELQRATAPLAPLHAGRAGLWLADEHYALLNAAPAASWAEGVATYVGGDTAVRPVVAARLPAALRAWLGRPVRVLGAGGAVCETRLQRFSLRAQVTPDPATAEGWEGCAEPRPSPAVIADAIWRASASSGRSLVGEFSAPCQGALIAVDPELPLPLIHAPEPASAELGESAYSEFRKLPAYAELQARYRIEQPDSAGAWDDHDARRGVWSLRLPGHRPLLFLSVEVGKVCSKFSASLSALWEESDPPGSAPLRLLATPKALDSRRLTPSAVIDLDAQGDADVLLGPDGQFAARALLTKSASSPSYAEVLLSSVPYFAGPC